MTADQQAVMVQLLNRLMGLMIALFFFSIFSLASVLLAKLSEVRAVKAEIDRIEVHLRKIDEQNQRSLVDRHDLRQRVEARP